MRTLRWLLVMACAVVGLLCTAASAGAAGTASGPIVWGPCSDPNLASMNAQCGFVTVPLDYRNPNGTKIQIAVSRIRHSAADPGDYKGVILTNPGGPGGSGLNLNPFLIQAMQSEGFGKAAADFDWIGFDPRGVGSSQPAITCNPNYFTPDRPNYTPFTSTLLHFWLNKSKGYAQDCGRANPLQLALLHHMTTVDVAKDMDVIRRALAKQRISYYGFSYGTDIGQTYATLFPSHVFRIILDSNTDMRRNGYHTYNLDQDRPFDRNMNIWFGWLARYHRVFRLGNTERAVRALFYSTRAKLNRHPAGGAVGPDEWTDIFQQAAYYEQTWLSLGPAFADWVHRHDSTAAANLISLYQSVDAPGSDNGFAVYLGVICTDSHWPHRWRRWSSDTWAIHRTAPFFAWSNTWYNAPCIWWPVPSRNQFRVNGSAIKDMLLIDETLDAATPFYGSVVTRHLFPHSVLLAEPGGTTHADSLSGDLCVDGTIARYLEFGTLPPRKSNAEWDKTCAPLPRPVPTAAAVDRAVRALHSPMYGEALRLGLPAVELQLRR